LKFRKVEDGFLVKLDKGDEVISTLTGFVKDQNIPSGFMTGMGSVKNATIGIFNARVNQYITKIYRDELEVGNLSGNIAWLEDSGEPFIHCHITVSNESLEAYTGHLFEATVLATMEIYIRVFKERLYRRVDPEMGNHLWHL